MKIIDSYLNEFRFEKIQSETRMSCLRIHLIRCIKTAIVLVLTTVFVTAPFVNCTAIEKRMLLNEIGSIDTNGEAMNVVLNGEVAFVLDTADNNPGGLVIIDVSDPTNPVKLASFYDGGEPKELAIKDDLVFVADSTDGLEILNISDLENPYEIYQYPVNQFSSDVEVIDNLLFAANWDLGFEIFNITNPNSPVKITQYNDNSLNCVQLDIKGDIACISDHRNDYTSLRILNISNPNSPQLLSTFSPANVDFWDPKIYGNHIYVGNHQLNAGELQVLDITDPTSIMKVGEFDDGGSIYSINFNNSLGFVADYDDGVEVLDIKNPTNPIEVGEYYDGGHAKEIVVKDNLLFVADRDDGLEILQAEISTDAVPGFKFQIILFSFPLIVFLYVKRNRSKE